MISEPSAAAAIDRTSRRSRWQVRLVGLAVVGLLVTGSAVSAPFWLIVDQLPSRPVTLAVPLGPNNSLFDAAAAWVLDGRAAQIGIYEKPLGRFESRGLMPSAFALFAQACDRQGIAAQRRLTLTETVKGTQHLGRHLNGLLDASPTATIAVFCPRLHTRSIRWKLDRELSPQNRQRLSVIAVAETDVDARFWMTDRSSTRAVIDACSQLLAQSLAQKSVEWTPRSDQELRDAAVGPDTAAMP